MNCPYCGCSSDIREILEEKKIILYRCGSCKSYFRKEPKREDFESYELTGAMPTNINHIVR